MEIDTTFRIILALLFAAFITHRGYYSRKRAKTPGLPMTERQADPLATLANLLAFPGLIALVIQIAYPRWISWASIPMPAWMRWLGAAVALAGFALLQWAQQALGRNWSDAPRLIAGQALVTWGPYRGIRHPIYAAFLLILGSTLLISANWLVGLTWIGMTALETVSRVAFEERILCAYFGDAYREYMKHTGRLLPRLSMRP